MGYLNFPPNLKDLFDDIQTRLRKLETAQRFTAPSVTADPANPRNGDIWLNTTSNALKVKDATGVTETINFSPVTTFVPVVSSTGGAITSYTVSTQYVTIGKFCSYSFTIGITNNGAGSGALTIGLPFTSASNSMGVTRESAVTGTEGQVVTYIGIGYAIISTYNNAYPVATGYQILGTLNYIIA